MAQNKLPSKNRFSLPFFQVGSGSFMVFSMMLIGILTYILLLFVDIYFIPSHITTNITYQLTESKIFQHFNEASVFNYITLIICTITIGFFMYIASYLVISMPAFYIRKCKFFKDSNERLDTIVKDSMNNSKIIPKIKIDLKFQDAFLYQLVSNSNSLLAENTRFAFTQLMYARSALFVMLSVSLYYILLVNIEIWILLVLLYCCFIIIYANALTYYETIMICNYIINQKKTKNNKNKKETNQ